MEISFLVGFMKVEHLKQILEIKVKQLLQIIEWQKMFEKC